MRSGRSGMKVRFRTLWQSERPLPRNVRRFAASDRGSTHLQQIIVEKLSAATGASKLVGRLIWFRSQRLKIVTPAYQALRGYSAYLDVHRLLRELRCQSLRIRPPRR